MFEFYIPFLDMLEFCIFKILLDLISPPANTKETEVRKWEERGFSISLLWKKLILKRKTFLQDFTEIYRFPSVKDKLKKCNLRWKMKTCMKFLPLLPGGKKIIIFVGKRKQKYFCLHKEKANFKPFLTIN